MGSAPLPAVTKFLQSGPKLWMGSGTWRWKRVTSKGGGVWGTRHSTLVAPHASPKGPPIPTVVSFFHPTGKKFLLQLSNVEFFAHRVLITAILPPHAPDSHPHSGSTLTKSLFPAGWTSGTRRIPGDKVSGLSCPPLPGEVWTGRGWVNCTRIFPVLYLTTLLCFIQLDHPRSCLDWFGDAR